jgi:hypothetical protein
MNGLHLYIAAAQIEREMHNTVQGAGPGGSHDPEDEQRHHARLWRLIRRDRVSPPDSVERPTYDPGLQPAAATSGR